jgi:hypothetical protein
MYAVVKTHLIRIGESSFCYPYFFFNEASSTGSPNLRMYRWDMFGAWGRKMP